MINRDFWTRWNAITVRKGREKRQFWGVSYFRIGVFLKEDLGLTPNISSQGETVCKYCCLLLPCGITTFSILFFLLFFVQNLCCNDSKYHSLNWKDVSVTNVDIFEKEQFSLQFFFGLLQVYIVYRVSFIFKMPFIFKCLFRARLY